MELKNIIENYKIEIEGLLWPLPEGWTWTETHGGDPMAYNPLVGGITIIDGNLHVPGGRGRPSGVVQRGGAKHTRDSNASHKSCTRARRGYLWSF